MSSSNITYFPQQQQTNVASPKHDHQQQYQYTQQSGISPNNVTINPNSNNHPNHQRPISNAASNTSSNTSNNTPHYNNQQPTPNQNQPQSDFLPLLNPSGISINSISFPHATIIIIPTATDGQNQLQQILASLNQSSSTNL
ncbi:hypothetical protein RclHR1_01610016 [Rhizophagus clarus]|uniref:Uncharacterized protein n=1 Tax=Rhizophagus clarus TaxID=94130 RepID=A0A2Z6QIF4_9GLOM|nr:hypothetical protein RclHR1_01610016 [Rhizophagus clarus]